MDYSLSGKTILVTGGTGSLAIGSTERQIAKGSYFFLPAAAAETTVRSAAGLEIVECLPPSIGV